MIYTNIHLHPFQMRLRRITICHWGFLQTFTCLEHPEWFCVGRFLCWNLTYCAIQPPCSFFSFLQPLLFLGNRIIGPMAGGENPWQQKPCSSLVPCLKSCPRKTPHPPLFEVMESSFVASHSWQSQFLAI